LGLLVPKLDSFNQRHTGNLNIWHYKDVNLQSELDKFKQIKEAEYIFAVGVEENKIISLEQPDSTKIVGGHFPHNYVITETVGKSGEQFWNNYKKTYQLAFLKNGSVKSLADNIPTFARPPKLSPKETFLSWYDYRIPSYRTYVGVSSIVSSIRRSKLFA